MSRYYKIYFVLLILKCTHSVRLNINILPINYQIYIKPYFLTNDDKKFTFDGRVNITIQCYDDNENVIKVNSNDLEIKLVKLNDVIVDSIDYDGEFIIIKSNDVLYVDRDYNLYIEYRGDIRNDTVGLYRSSYYQDGAIKWFAVTQLHSIHARKVFPCFDEPSFKATFDLIIERPTYFKESVTNAKLKTSLQLDNGYTLETFSTTPKMSTYLIAILISEFEKRNDNDANTNESLSVVVRRDTKHEIDYAYQVAKKAVNILNDYFAIDYFASNAKLDHVAVLNLGVSAMENWGLITYRETRFLFNENETNPLQKKEIAKVVSHETAHMWFGNLVTCHWFSDAWLNEGFATYFQIYVSNQIDPELGTSDDAVVIDMFKALKDGQQITTVPISHNVSSLEEINGHFGVSTYQKAASVIRMIRYWIGEEAFKNGVRDFLNKRKFNISHPTDIYESFEKSRSTTGDDDLKQSVSDVMKTWIEKQGYPLLLVYVDENNKTIKLTQRRFYVNQTYKSNELFSIPVTYVKSDNLDFSDTNVKLILNKQTEYINTETLDEDQWFIFNVQGTGLYRVNYDNRTWNMIVKSLKRNIRSIHYLNRALLINDATALTESGEISFERLFDIYDCLTNETDYNVWFVALSSIDTIVKYFNLSKYHVLFQKYIQKLMKNIIEYLGYNEKSSDTYKTKLNRVQIMKYACYIGHDKCNKHYAQIFDDNMKNNTSVSSGLRPVVYCAGLSMGGEHEFNYMWNKMLISTPTEDLIIKQSLGCTINNESLYKFLSQVYIDTGGVFRVDERILPFTVALNNPSNIMKTLDFVQQHLHELENSGVSLTKILQLFPKALDRTQLNQFEDWFNSCHICLNNTDVKILQNEIIERKSQMDTIEASTDEMENALKKHYKKL